MVALILVFLISASFAMVIMMVTWLLLVAVAKGTCRCRRIPFDPGKRLVRTLGIVALAPALVVLYLMLCPFWVPQQKTFASPDGKHVVNVGFYADLASIDEYRGKITLRDVGTGQILGQARHNIRDIFLTGFDTHTSIAWETALYVEWDQREGAPDNVRVVYPEMDTAFLLPSGREVSPLSDLEPLDGPGQGKSQ